MSRILPVPEGLEGERIDVALATMLGLSRARSSALVEGGAVQVGNRVVAVASSFRRDDPTAKFAR